MQFFGGGFPFGGFGQDHDHDEQQEDNVGEIDNKRYYEIMEIQPQASDDDIKKKYKQLAKKYHPDRKGGNSQKFSQISQAYEILGDPEKRRIYDKYGTKGPQTNQEDILKMFFGGGRGGQSAGKKQLPKMKPTQKPLEVSLEQIYNGGVILHKHERTRLCEGCGGKGGANVRKCVACKGQGRVLQMYQMGAGMYQQVQKECEDCKGEGQFFDEDGKCKICDGRKVVKKQKELQVPIDKGIPHQFAIVLNGEGNQIPDALSGDLILVVQQKPHEIFTRKGADLFLKKNINLIQALLGFQFKLRHLDGLEYTVYTVPGEIVGDGDRKVIRGLGMPFFKDSMNHGNLIVEFKVEMPKRGQITKQQLSVLEAVLPGHVNPRPEGHAYQMLEDFDKQNVNSSEQGGKKKDEDEQQQQQGGCQAQ